jgi:hypothetical protein
MFTSSVYALLGAETLPALSTALRTKVFSPSMVP